MADGVHVNGDLDKFNVITDSLNDSIRFVWDVMQHQSVLRCCNIGLGEI